MRQALGKEQRSTSILWVAVHLASPKKLAARRRDERPPPANKPLHARLTRSRAPWYLAAGGALFSAALYVATQLSMLLTKANWSWSSIRTFGFHDQMSYFAEVVNAAHGNFAAVEPFTETGTNNDPHLYYQLLGGISYTTGVAPADVWNLVGVALEIVLVVGLSLASVSITRRWWTAYFGAVPFLIGTASIRGGGWATGLHGHAILWGVFAAMFPLNSETASLCIVGLLFLLLLVVAARPVRPRTMLTTAIVLGAGVGLLANLHTYVFLTAVYVSLYGIAAYAIVTRRKWRPALLSVALIVVLFLLGPLFASTFGRLVTLAFGLLPAVPGTVLATARWRARIICPLVAALLTASPQLLSTLLSLQAGNAFLKFREASSSGLGVDWQDGLLHAAPVLVPLLLILAAGIHRRQPLWTAYSLGLLTAWLLLAKNDVWGANQEPYRLWIECFVLTAFTIIPMTVVVGLTYLSRHEPGVDRASRSLRAVVATLATVAVVIAGVSSVDWVRFYRAETGQAISLSTPYNRALQTAAARVTGDALIMAGPCINQEILKAVSGARVDYYNYGLAWPTRMNQINLVRATAVWKQLLVLSELHAANIGWLMTDGSCRANWAKRYSNELVRIAASSYGPKPRDVITLWRFESPT